ncbi:GPP34 family phosphoprotein [Thermoactinomyces sp. AMNI-1]|uniref:GPP34 family phosphoprotein n=2 Tax=Thermoactinomyces mirandus TaxID=2756294 RepID=A0A7W1XRR9_9BACL|nr:GPP34 family phosphoprotein [Thermoactinomyces mirandus]
MDRVLAVVRNKENKPKSLKKWIVYFYYRQRLRRQVHQAILQSLVQKGAMKVEESKDQLIPWKKYLDIDQAREFVVQKIGAELLEPGTVEKSTATLCLLLEKTNLLKSYYEEKQLKEKLKEIKEQEQESIIWVKEVCKAINEIEAAIMASFGGAVT